MDHPHGGGRGKSKGNRHPTSPWGTPVRYTHLVEDDPIIHILTYALSPKVVTRHVGSTTPISGLWFLGYETWASGETRRASHHRNRLAFGLTCIPILLRLYVQFTVSARARLMYRIVLYATELMCTSVSICSKGTHTSLVSLAIASIVANTYHRSL